ncbi:MAG: pyridoxal phosphate-dependent aminotransferase [Candidatus Cloacimonetes bacterium]|nr:pyridoxal phosphate-dependent aminotransferase [Candidatus Cloacimonadota bacterium]
MKRLSHRARCMQPSPTLKVSALAKKMMKEGIEVINFGVGEPDFNTPEYIKQSAKQAIDNNYTRYTPSAGIPELKQAIIRKFQRDNGLNYEAENILVSPGAKASLINVLMTVCDPRDEVVIPTPSWVSYESQVWLCDAHPELLEATMSNNFKITAAQLSAKVKTLSNPKVLILNSPNNPTGMVYSREELQSIGEVCLENDMIILSDEIYEKLIYDGNQHISIASLSRELQDNTVVVNGVSKAYAMTGWRLGYMAGPEAIVKKASEIQSHTTSCVNSITQRACVTALDEDDGSVEKMRQEFSRRRDFMCSGLNGIAHVNCVKPQGAFYIMPDVSWYLENNQRGITSSEELCQYLLTNYHLALVAGSAFRAEGFVRFSYANSLDNIRKGIEWFDQGLQSLLKKS